MCIHIYMYIYIYILSVLKIVKYDLFSICLEDVLGTKIEKKWLRYCIIKYTTNRYQQIVKKKTCFDLFDTKYIYIYIYIYICARPFALVGRFSCGST